MSNSILTQSRLKELVRYNKATGVFTRLVSRGPAKEGTVATNAHNEGYLRFKIDGVNYLAHRLAWLYVYGEFPTGPLDHRNGDRAANFIRNLRVAPPALNAQNQRVAQKTNPYLGVSWHAQCGKWKAAIRVRKKSIHLGLYDSAEVAAYAYQYAKKKLHPYAPRKSDVRSTVNNRLRVLTKQKVDEILSAFDWGVDE
jgi:hypothetical protein